jgi:hypothetical protein
MGRLIINILIGIIVIMVLFSIVISIGEIAIYINDKAHSGFLSLMFILLCVYGITMLVKKIYERYIY